MVAMKETGHNVDDHADAQEDFHSFLGDKSGAKSKSGFLSSAAQKVFYGLVALFLALIVVAAIVILVIASRAEKRQKKNEFLEKTVFVFSIDGFRYDYWHDDKFASKCPTLLEIAKHGVIAEKMLPSFPTKTFPNHYTLVTGKYPASHGILANNFYDRNLKVKFNMSSLETHWWENAEPIWITAVKFNYSSSVVFWPGSSSEIHGLRPTNYQPVFIKDYGDKNKIDLLMTYLDADLAASRKKEPNHKYNLFYGSYFDGVDTAGHSYGPDSNEVANAIASIDSTLSYFIGQLRNRSIDPYNDVHIVLVSDHGMAKLNRTCQIKMTDIISASDMAQLKITNFGPFVDIYDLSNTPDLVERVYQNLKAADQRYTVYRKDEIPERLHYNQMYTLFPDRAPDLAISLAENCVMGSSTFNSLLGDHGYDTNVDSMGALFVASGPKIAKSTKPLAPFENIHLYPLLANIMEFKDKKILPAIDGSIEKVKSILKVVVSE